MNYEGQLYTRHQHLRPATQRTVNAGSLQYTETMQKVQAHDDETLGSGSSLANAINDGTDTFGREIMQHERDARRLRNATRSDQQPFIKTRPRPRISELIARREREETLAAGHKDQYGRPGSTGSNDSDPPLNVPRDWGTRAKSHRGWMRKIREPSDADIRIPPDNGGSGLLTPEDDAVVPGNKLWSQQDEDLPLMQNTPPSMRRGRPNPQATSLHEANSTLRHIIDSEDQEFGELSLLASTPAAVKPTRERDTRVNHESRAYERTDLVRDRWDLLSERSPNRYTSQRRSLDRVSDADNERPIAARNELPRPVTAYGAESRLARRNGLISNKENIPASDASDFRAKANDNVTISDRTARAVTFKQHQRPAHARSGSLHLLQRLATSMSPSPGRSSSDAAHSSAERPVSNDRTQDTRQRAISDDRAESHEKVVRTARRKSSNERRGASEPVAPRHHTGSERVSQSSPKEMDATPAPREDALNDKTPVITGAWVDTPGPPAEARPLLQSSHSVPSVQDTRKKDEASNKISKAFHDDPNRPKSALEDIVREARRDPTGPFGDATIQSLEDIVHPNTDPTDTTLNFDTISAEATENLDIGRPLTQAEKDRRQEDLAIEAMNKHLRTARTSIKDADRGLRRVGNKWESTTHPDDPQPQTQPQQIAASSQRIQVTKLDHDWKTVCAHCGGSYQSVWRGLWTEFRSNFYVYDPTARYTGIRLTWLGLLTLLWALWTVLENTLCSYYCHPLYAYSMVGYGINPDAPRYPFVIPTLLFRPLRPVWKPAFAWLRASFMAVFHMVFGEPEKERVPRFMQPGFKLTEDMINWDAWQPGEHVGRQTWAGRAARATATAVAATSGRVAGSFVDAVDAMGMDGDEYL